MYKTSNIVVSTPIKYGVSSNASCSVSDIKYTSSDSVQQNNEINNKEHTFDTKKKKRKIKRKKKFSKIKSTNKKLKCINKRGRRFVLSDTSDTESEIEFIKRNKKKIDISSNILLSEREITNVNEQCESKCKLFISPERIRDINYNHDHDNLILSPSLISERSNPISSLRSIDNDENIKVKENNQENNISSDEDLNQITITPILKKSNRTKKYPPAKLTRWKRNLLKNTIYNDWPSDYKVSTHYADLLWDNYVNDHSDELPQHYQASTSRKINNTEINEISDKDETSDNDSLEMLNLLDEHELKLTKSKSLCRIRGTLNKNNKSLPINIDRVVYVTDETNDSKSEKGEWIRRRETFDYTSNDSNDDYQKKSFNEFCARQKMQKLYSRKRNKNRECYSFSSSSSSSSLMDNNNNSNNNSNVKVKSITYLKSKKYKKKSDNNYYLLSDQS